MFDLPFTIVPQALHRRQQPFLFVSPFLPLLPDWKVSGMCKIQTLHDKGTMPDKRGLRKRGMLRQGEIRRGEGLITLRGGFKAAQKVLMSQTQPFQQHNSSSIPFLSIKFMLQPQYIRILFLLSSILFLPFSQSKSSLFLWLCFKLSLLSFSNPVD